jgi:hypothetical protein
MTPVTRAPSAMTTVSPTRTASVVENSTVSPSSAVAEEMFWSSLTRILAPSGNTIWARHILWIGLADPN